MKGSEMHWGVIPVVLNGPGVSVFGLTALWISIDSWRHTL